MVNYWKIVNDCIFKSDVILLVVDARFPELTRNKEIEIKIEERRKKIIYVINKSDLVEKKKLEKLKKDFKPAVFVSAKKRLGGTMLFKKIMSLARGEKITVAVLGFPNVGKSSVINLLKGGSAASVSPLSGHTKGRQKVNIKRKFILLDTPGVLQFKERDIFNEILIGSRNVKHVKEPDYFAMLIMERYPRLFEHYFNIPYNGDPDSYLEEIGRKNHILKKGNEIDRKRTGRRILLDWQRGKVHEKYLKKK